MLNWPLKDKNYPIPSKNDPGAFGVQRKGYIHPGVDLYCKPYDEIYAIEDGIVINIEDFTGSKVGTPWWNDTQAILIEGKTGVFCYGEVEPLVEIGDTIRQGQLIAKAITVLKRWKGNPMTMLHFEMYKHGTKKAEEWIDIDKKPSNLLDPTKILKIALSAGGSATSLLN